MKRWRHSSRFYSWVVVLWLAASCARPAPDGPAPRAYDVASYLDSVAAHSPWPGFDPQAIPLAVYDGATTWMFRHPHGLAGFHPIDSLPETQVYSGQHPLMRANTSLEWDGIPTATLLLDTLVNPSPSAWARVAAHEAFHVFQRAHYPTWGGNDVQLFVYPMTDTLNLELRRLETLSLRAAILSTDREDAACWARAAVHARKERFGFLDSASVAYERGTEMLEGLAEYVGARASGTGISIPAPSYAPEDVRARSYAIGAAMGDLLDRLDPAWKATLAAHPDRHLDELLEQAAARPETRRFCGPVPEDLRVLKTAARADIADLDARLQARREEFLTAPGWRLIVEATNAPLFPKRFDPLNVLRVTGLEVLHTRHLELGNEQGTIEILNRSALTLGNHGHPLFAGVLRLTVTGLPASPTVRDSSGVVFVEGNGIVGRFRGASIEARERVTVVTLGSRE